MAKQFDLEALLAEENITGRLAELKFESGLKLLEELVAKVESGSLPLDAAVSSYEKGAQLVAHLRSLLSGAEEKLKLLQKVPKV